MDIRLCGGTLFTLLTSEYAKRPNTKKKLTVLGQTSTVSENSMFVSFFRLLNPNHQPYNPGTMRNSASCFKNCTQANGAEFPLNDSSYTKAFHTRVMNSYKSVLSDATDYCRYFLRVEDTEAMTWLVRALLELLSEDTTISGKHNFYALPSGKTISKSDLLTLKTIHLPALLVGLLDYIVIYAQNNKIGAKTIFLWQERKDEKYQAAKLRQSIGATINRPITVVIDDADQSQTPSASDMAGLGASAESNSDAFPGCREYMSRLADKYNCLPTILHKEPFTPFRDYYVPNNISMRVRNPDKTYSYSYKTLENVSLDRILSVSHFIFLTGTGGLGKSMMMRNFVLSAIDQFSSLGLVPFFISLKDYDQQYESFLDYIYEMVHHIWPELIKDSLLKILLSGKALLLFDGLDEINTKYLSGYTKAFNDFHDQYGKNYFIISSRPYSNFQSFYRFVEMKLQPLTKDQALLLFDHFNYRSDAPKLQSRFRTLLDTKLYYTHKGFVDNPLLLSIMILTFEMDGEIPTVKHEFYQEAYTVLSKRHDASKDGYVRALQTGWTFNQFADYFSYFCAKTYYDGKISFSHSSLEDYFRDIQTKYRFQSATVDDFIYDVTNNLCLMCQDNLDYTFIHRSFQEYFCAKFLHNQLDEKLTHAIPMFRRYNQTKRDDDTLPMLFEMKPNAVEKYIVIPYLRDCITRFENANKLWSFLEEIYPFYQCADGVGEPDEDECQPHSNLYAFILDHYNVPLLSIDPTHFPGIEDALFDKLVYREDTDEDVYEADLPSNYDYYYGDPEVTGHIYSFNWEKFQAYPQRYETIIKSIEDPKSPFMQEYKAIKDLLHKLEAKSEESQNSENIFDHWT